MRSGGSSERRVQPETKTSVLNTARGVAAHGRSAHHGTAPLRQYPHGLGRVRRLHQVLSAIADGCCARSERSLDFVARTEPQQQPNNDLGRELARAPVLDCVKQHFRLHPSRLQRFLLRREQGCYPCSETTLQFFQRLLRHLIFLNNTAVHQRTDTDVSGQENCSRHVAQRCAAHSTGFHR